MSQFEKSALASVIGTGCSQRGSAMTQSRQLNHSSQLGGAPHQRKSGKKNCRKELPPTVSAA
jgi:hypothetical protein